MKKAKLRKPGIPGMGLMWIVSCAILLLVGASTALATTKTLLATGLSAPVGAALDESKNQLYFVEYNPAANGKLKRITLPPACAAPACAGTIQTIAGGFSHPEDVQLDLAHGYAYLTTRDDAGTSGALWKVKLSTGAKTMVTFNLGAPQQIFLDVANNQAFTVGYDDGRLRRIDLTTGAKTPVATGLHHPVGLAVTQDRKYAYVTEQDAPARISKIDLTTGANLGPIIVNGVGGVSLVSPFFLAWTDSSQNSLYVAERGAANKVSRVEILTYSKNEALTEAAPVPAWWGWPTGIVVSSLGSKAFVTTGSAVIQADLVDLTDLTKEPIFTMVGNVPSGKISDFGYANTDPGYFYSVKHSPFGGTLNIFGNLSRFKSPPLNASYYQVQVSKDGGPYVPLNLSWNVYKYNTATGEDDLVPVAPDPAAPNPAAGPKYLIPAEYPLNAARWKPPFLMMRWPSGENGLYAFRVRIFNAAGGNIPFPVAWKNSLAVMIDNTPPEVKLVSIWQKGCPGNPAKEVMACDIVSAAPNQFYFRITANDPNQHLLNYGLTAMWGDNQSEPVYADSYSNHVAMASPHAWGGVQNFDVPRSLPGSGGAATTWSAHIKCAHTFYLGAWKRTIDGYNYLLYRDYHKSITINNTGSLCLTPLPTPVVPR
jgi:DNA-binding beta-propeller fold protein YncE